MNSKVFRMACQKWPIITRFLKILFGAFSLFAIYIIKFTEYRPFGTCEHYEETNEIIVNLSYSYLAAILFHIVMVYIPSLQREKLMKSKTDFYFAQITAHIEQCVSSINLYDFSSNDNQILPKKKFIEVFKEVNFTSECFYLSILKNNRTKINSKIDFLFSFQDVLSSKELDLLYNLRETLFLSQQIIPKDYIENDYGEKIEIPYNNQNDMAISIYHTYELIKQHQNENI